MLRLDRFDLYIVKLIVKSIARNGDVYLKRQNLVGLVANMFPHVSFTQRSVFLVVFLVIATSRPGLSGTSQRPGWSLCRARARLKMGDATGARADATTACGMAGLMIRFC